MKRLLNIGSINIDYVYRVPHFLRAGETLEADTRDIFMGGKGLNQTVGLPQEAALKWRTRECLAKTVVFYTTS